MNGKIDIDVILNTKGDVANKIKSELKSVEGSADSINTKLKNAFSNLGAGVGAKLNTINLGFNKLKNPIISASNNIRTRLGSAIDYIKAKMAGLSGRFNKFKNDTDKMGNSLGFLRTAASMTVGMIGYDLVNSIAQTTRESINASGNLEGFAQRLRMSASELDAFKKECDSLQTSFKKVDMRAVGASSAELANKLKIPKNELGELTKMTAVMGSAFVKEGRTQEESILAISDAMDGQFRRLQEIGITQDRLKANGWNGNLEDSIGLMKALNKTMDELGHTETATSIYTLDDAYKAISVSLSRLLADIIIPLTPAITRLVDVLISAINSLKSIWSGLPDWASEGLKIGALSTALVGIAYVIEASVIPSILGAVGAFTSLSIAGAPLWAVIGAVSLLAVGFYALGNSLGWWSDVDSMFSALSAGVQRLWASFINHPAVISAIDGLKGAWTDFSNAMKPVMDELGKLWNTLFPSSAKTQFDAIGLTISILGATIGNFASGFVQQWRMIYQILSVLGTVIVNFALGFIQQWRVIYAVITTVGNSIMAVLNFMITGWQQLPSRVVAIVTSIIATAQSFGANIGARMRQAGSNFVNGFVNNITSLPSRVSNSLMNVLNAVTNWGGQMLNKASQIASDFAARVTGGLMGNYMGIEYEGFNTSNPVNYEGFDMPNNTLNNTLSNNINNNKSNTTINNYLSGIIEKPVAEFFVDTLNDEIKKQRLAKGV